MVKKIKMKRTLIVLFILNSLIGYSQHHMFHFPTSIKNGLLALWEMNEPSTAGICQDATPNDIDLTYFNIINNQTGKLDKSYLYTDVNPLLLCYDSDLLDGIGSISLISWVYLNDFQTGNDYNSIISSRHSTWTTLNKVFKIFLGVKGGTDQYVSFRVATSTVFAETISPSNSFKETNWVFIAATYDSSSGTLQLYIDGVLKSGATLSGGGDIQSNTSNNFKVGHGDVDAVTNHWDGYIDQTGVFNVALTSSQVTLLYNGDSGIEYINW
jgi:hypothetical protein